MNILLSSDHLKAIEAHGEASYPNEGAGFLLGRVEGETVRIDQIMPIENKREQGAQHNRYELLPADYAHAEMEAAHKDIDVVGVFHSHPDHPSRPSDFDRDHALPHFSYLITAVAQGETEITQAWRLREDRSAFDEDHLTHP
jgi:proteasome lid subunit RPN8/RPN11